MGFSSGGVDVFGPRTAEAMALLAAPETDLDERVGAAVDPYADIVTEIPRADVHGVQAGHEFDPDLPDGVEGIHVDGDTPDLVVTATVDDEGTVPRLEYDHAGTSVLVDGHVEDHDVAFDHQHLSGAGAPTETLDLPDVPDAVERRTTEDVDREVPTVASYDADEERVRLVVGPFPDRGALDHPLADEVVWYAFPDESTADRVPEEVDAHVVTPEDVGPDEDLAERLGGAVDEAIGRERATSWPPFEPTEDPLKWGAVQLGYRAGRVKRAVDGVVDRLRGGDTDASEAPAPDAPEPSTDTDAGDERLADRKREEADAMREAPTAEATTEQTDEETSENGSDRSL